MAIRYGITMIEVHYEVLLPDAIVPTRARVGRAYYDIRSAETVDILPGKIHKVRTGLKMQAPQGYFIEIRPRSSIATKYFTNALYIGAGTAIHSVQL